MKTYTRTSRKAGFTLVEIMIVVAIIGMLAAIAIPNFVKARKSAQTNACINNLRQIDGAKQQWALETGQGSAAQPANSDLQVYLGRGDAGSVNGIYCPLVAAGALAGYTLGTVGAPPVCIQYNVATHKAVLN